MGFTAGLMKGPSIQVGFYINLKISDLQGMICTDLNVTDLLSKALLKSKQFNNIYLMRC